jgi:large subunit ribosomal protein L28
LEPDTLYCRMPRFLAAESGSSEGEVPMAQHCHFCGKTPMTGKNVSHAHNVTSRKWHLNLQSVRAVIAPGTTRRVRACSRCLRSGKVVKPLARKVAAG